MLYSLAKALLLPPTGLFLLILLGLFWWRHIMGRALILIATLSLLILSFPIVSHKLMEPLEPYPALTPADLRHPDAQAIVLLSAGRYTDALEYGGDSIGPISLQRTRYAAWLQRRTGLPLIVTGGPADEQPPVGRLMVQVLEQEFRVPVAAVEEQSHTTWENAAFTIPILERLGINRILLVSSAWHLPRAVWAFEHHGLKVTPAPTVFEHRDFSDGLQPEDFYPDIKALQRSYYAIHEYIGRLWYTLRNG